MFGAAFARVSLGVLHSLAGGFAVFCLRYSVVHPFLTHITIKPMLMWGAVAVAAAYAKDHYFAG
jgi:hypothetical protein